MAERAASVSRPINVLLVEDNPGDIRLIQEALKRSKMTIGLHVVMDGNEAIAFLRREGKHAEAAAVDMVILDLSLPGKGGREVLAEIKADKRLRRIPVMIHSSSSAPEDIAKSYDLHANCYITKSLDLEQLMKVVQSVEDFWFTVVKLPSAIDDD